MRPIRLLVSMATLLAFFTMANVANAIPITAQTFEDGTTMGWFVPGPSPNPPTNVDTGGPAGPGDSYLQVQAVGGNVPGGRLAVLNESIGGDYLGAGIKAIRMDVNNLGPDDLVLRLLFENFPDGPPGPPPTDIALTLANIVVPAGSGWQRVVFDLSPANLAAGVFGTVAGALGDVDIIRIFHNPAPAFPGPGVGIPPVVATLGVDNIRAVPEPLTGVLLVIGAGAALGRRTRGF